MYEAKDAEGFWWRFYCEPSLTESGWQCTGHVSYIPGRVDDGESWRESIKKVG